MSPLTGLSAVNFFLADVQGGLGPFLATWLAQAAQWDPARIGLVMTIAGIAGLLCNGPAGSLVDRLRTPRLLLGLAAMAVVSGTLGLLVARSFTAVLATQVVIAAAARSWVPGWRRRRWALSARTVSGRQGRNRRGTMAGNVIAASWWRGRPM